MASLQQDDFWSDKPWKRSVIAARDADPMRIAGLGKDERDRPCDQRVVARHDSDPLGRAQALGDVLEQQHGATEPRAARDFEIALAGELKRHLAAGGLPVLVLQQLLGEGGQSAIGHRDMDEIGERLAQPVARRQFREQRPGPVVDHGHGAVFVEHAEAVLHGVERGIEFVGEARSLGPAVHGAEQDAAHVGRQKPEADQHREQREGDEPVIAVVLEQEAGHDQRDDDRQLDREHPVETEIARHDANHAGDGRNEAEQFGERVVDEDEASETPRAAEEGEDGGVVGGANFPARGSLHIGGSDFGFLEPRHVEEASGAGENEAGCDHPHDVGAGDIPGRAGTKHAARCANDHCPTVGIDRATDRDIV